MDVEKIRDTIKEPREKLLNHKLYTEIKSIEDLQIFTSNHIFAVWDFMSLLKALQNNLTCTKVPWIPNKNSETAYLINEIVLAEETDISQDGKRKSHYELYLDAMIDIGVKVENISSIAAAGADTFVAGSAVFDSADYKQSISALRANL